MDTILITGASGLLGHAVVERLARLEKYNIIAVVSGRKIVKSNSNRVTIEVANLLDKEATSALLKRTNPDIICHFAWALEEKDFRNSDDNLLWIEASLHLLREFRGKRFIYSGSSSQYGLLDGKGGKEYSLYGVSKLSFEKIAENYYAKKGIRFVSARYFTIYGPGDVKQDAAIPNAIQTLLRHEKFLCKAPSNLWDFIYVDDAAEAMVRLIQSNLDGTLDIATGHPVAMRTVFNTIAEEIGCLELLEYNEGNLNTTSLTADIFRLEKELGYVCKVPLARGIAETVNWWKRKD